MEKLIAILQILSCFSWIGMTIFLTADIKKYRKRHQSIIARLEHDSINIGDSERIMNQQLDMLMAISGKNKRDISVLQKQWPNELDKELLNRPHTPEDSFKAAIL